MYIIYNGKDLHTDEKAKISKRVNTTKANIRRNVILIKEHNPMASYPWSKNWEAIESIKAEGVLPKFITNSLNK